MPDKKGYSFDGCSPLYLIENAKVNDGKIEFPGGGSYRLMVLPQVETMTPELLTKIKSLISDGAIVIGNPPVKSPSLVNYPGCDDQIKKLASDIWGTNKMPADLQEKKYGKGQIWWGEKILKTNNTGFVPKDTLNIYPDYQVAESILNETGINQDFSSAGNIRYNHRSMPDREIYFISNRTGNVITDTCFFRNGTSNAEIWNPVTGEINRVKPSRLKKSFLLKIRMEPWQSYFVVFYKTKSGKDSGKQWLSENTEEKIVTTLEGPWNVTFDTIWGGPDNVVFEELSDWSKHNDEGIKYYSGTAVYTKRFNGPPESDPEQERRLFLDLGKVYNMARVKLNGKDLGVVWTAPWQVEITGNLKPADNILEIEVANLWINRLIGDEKEPWDGISGGKWPEWLINGKERPSNRYTFTTHRFYKKDDPLNESGLKGPVVIKQIYKAD
jgi:hypothetical protein